MRKSVPKKTSKPAVPKASLPEGNYFDSPEDFRDWLKTNHNRETEIWLGYYKKDAPIQGIGYKESVDAALCFGWIDGIVKSIDQHRYCRRFTPRKKNSIWSQVNIRRYCELKEMGLVHPAGAKVFDARDERRQNLYSFEQEKHELGSAFEKKFKAKKTAWKNFHAMTPSYRKAATWWVVSAKQESTRLNRLDILIENSQNGRKIPLLRRTGEV